MKSQVRPRPCTDVLKRIMQEIGVVWFEVDIVIVRALDQVTLVRRFERDRLGGRRRFGTGHPRNGTAYQGGRAAVAARSFLASVAMGAK